MGSSFQYNVLAGFRAVDAWQQTIVQNVQGLLLPGYNRRKLHIGSTGGTDQSPTRGATQQMGSRTASSGGGDTLALQGHSIIFEQGTIDPVDIPTSLAIRGPGFFMLAENDRPGAKVYLTRNGDFRYDAQGRLVNAQGLFVVGGNGAANLDADGRTVGVPRFVTDPGDGTVDLPQVSLAKVPAPQALGFSGYGSTTYEITPASGAIQVFPNGRVPEVGFVQPSSIEMPSRVGWSGIFQAETFQATQTYKIFKDMLTEFNKTVDDSINVVR